MGAVATVGASIDSAWAVAGLVTTALSVVAVIAAAVYVGRSKIVSENVARLRDLNETLTAQNELQGKQLMELRAELQAERTRSDKQDQELANLRQMVQGVEAMAKLSQRVDEFSAQLEESHSQLMAAILRRDDR